MLNYNLVIRLLSYYVIEPNPEFLDAILKNNSKQLGFKEFDPKDNYGQVYIRTDNIENLYKSLLEKQTEIHPNGKLGIKPN